ncbi:MAG: Uncharacterized protein FD151_2188 [bacterium]|nr:MAG: Uncharacterized protein FD151_2188 [bacterium]
MFPRMQRDRIDMAFIEIPGLKGKMYVPDQKPGHTKKHDCKDCYSCQICSDNRCQLCLRQGSHRIKRHSQEK